MQGKWKVQEEGGVVNFCGRRDGLETVTGNHELVTALGTLGTY